MRKDGDDLRSFVLDQEHIDLLHRGRVADAFVEVLCERGYPATTVGDIASRAAMSSRTFYRLYDNKEDAFLAVHDRLRTRACDRMRAAMDRHEAPRDKLCAALRAVLAEVDAHPRWGRVFVADGPAADGAGEPLYLSTIRAWLDEVADLLPEHEDMTRVEQGAAVCGMLRARLAGGQRRASQLLPALTQVLLGERVDGVAEAPLGDGPAPAPELSWDVLVAALLDHDLDVLAALQRCAEERLGDGDGGGGDGDGPEHVELAAIAQAAAVGRHGGTAAVLALVGHGTGEGLPSRQSLRCLRFVAAHPGTSGRGVLHGLGFRNESQVSRLLGGLAARGLAIGAPAAGGARAWTATPAGEALLAGIGLPAEPPEPGEAADAAPA